jgi:hypothetical protein
MVINPATKYVVLLVMEPFLQGFNRGFEDFASRLAANRQRLTEWGLS